MLKNINEELLKTFNDESEAAESSAVWESHANNIIIGIEANDEVKPVRAIWEMVQNARDERKPDSLAEIVFTRKAETFVFQHNGMPFTKTALFSLIIQTSSKNQNDPEKVGKYGTGFLITHKFGREFHLYSSLRLRKDADYFYNFNDFVIDRSSEDKFFLGKSIQNKVKETKDWNQLVDKITTTASNHTIFTYHHRDDQEKANAYDAMNDAPILVPYVIALNKGIGSIEFIDEVLNNKIKFVRCGDYDTIEENEDYVLKSCNVSVLKDENTQHLVTIYLLESRDEQTIEDEPRVTVILPIKRSTNGYDTFLFEKSVPRLFLHLPLLGTSDWALNFIVHAPKFSCDKESRDNIRFSGNSDETMKKSIANRELLELANKIILQFVDYNIEKIQHRKYLGVVKYRLLDVNEKTKEYFKTQQDWWVEQMESRKLVECDKVLQTSEIKVLDEELIIACTGDSVLLDAIYYLFDKAGENAPTHPKKEDMLYWSRVINDWYEDKEKYHFLTASHIADLIACMQFEKNDLPQLLIIERYFADNNKTKLFEDKAILPNIDLKLCKREGMLNSVEFSNAIMEILRKLCPETVSLITHPDFAKLIKLDSYNNESMKNSITQGIKDMVALQKAGEVQKDKVLENFNAKQYKPTFFTNDAATAILKLYIMIVEEDGDSVESKALPSFRNFYDFDEVIADIVEKDLFDRRTCFYALLRDSLFKFTCMDDKEKDKMREWIYGILKATQVNSDTRKILTDYEICPDQLGDFHYVEKLKREGSSMKPELKTIYDIVIKHVTKENNSNSLLHSLIQKDFNSMVAENSVTTGHSLASDLERIVKDEYHYDLKDKTYTDYFVNIIKKLSGHDQEALDWQDLFKDINSHKGTLLLSAIESEKKKDYIFNFINANEDKLEVMSKLMDDPNLTEIIRLGKEQIKQQQRDDNELNFKLKLGKYVENFLRSELSTSLGDMDLHVPEPVKDEQGGQDIVIKLGDEIVYYIEVKSRWGTDRAVLMSTRQHENSIKHASNYALCAVDMSGYLSEYGEEAIDLHIYPENPCEIKDRMRMLERIGYLNTDISDACTAKKEKVYVESGYRVHVTQDVIKSNSVTFDIFEKNLVAYIKSLL